MFGDRGGGSGGGKGWRNERGGKGNFNRREHGQQPSSRAGADQVAGDSMGSRFMAKRMQAMAEARGPREQGVINVLKESFGFIKCADRPGDIFFYHTEAPRDVGPGTEVEFFVEAADRDGRLSATGLTILPPGTVVVEEMMEGLHRGVVKQDLRSTARKTRRNQGDQQQHQQQHQQRHQQRRETVEGTICITSDAPEVDADGDKGNGASNLLPFLSHDLNKDQPPSMAGAGAEVEFSICVEKCTKRRRATNIRVLRSARQIREEGALAGVAPEEGIVRMLKDQFGFIQSTSRKATVFFRFSDVKEPPSRRLEIGQEVAFHCLTEMKRSRMDGSKQEQYRAANITFLTPGSVTFEEMFASRVAGTVKRGVADLTARSRGTIQVMVPPTADGAGGAQAAAIMKEVLFNGNDVEGTCALRAGDEVILDVFRVKADKSLQGKQLTLMNLSARYREQGVVTAVKDGFGFIRCCQRDMDVYYRASEVLGEEPLQQGSEVEFDVVEGKDGHDRSRFKAERIKLLSAGTVWFEAQLAEALSAEVTKDARGGSGGGGTLRCLESPPEIPVELEYLDVHRVLEEFLESDELETQCPGLSPRQTSVHARVAISLNLGYKLGKILTIFKFESDQAREAFKAPALSNMVDPNPSTFRFERSHQRHPETSLCRGDVVNFDLTMDRRSLRRCARNIVVVKAAVKAPEEGGECRGLVHSVVPERHFGFAICEDTNAKVFFHLSAFQKDGENSNLDRGDSIVFNLAERNGKQVAVNVRLLPKGSVQLEEEEPGRRVGVIAVQPVTVDDKMSDGKIVLLDDALPSDELRILPFSLEDREEGTAETKEETTEVSSEGADAEEFCVGRCVSFTVFSSRIRRSLKRAGRVAVSRQPLLVSAKGSIVEVQGKAGVIKPSAMKPDAAASQAASQSSKSNSTGSGADKPALPQDSISFFTFEALDPVRPGDEVSYLVVPPSEEGPRESGRAVAVAQALGLRFAGGPRIKRQYCVDKFQYREAKRPEKNSLGFEEGWRERLRVEREEAATAKLEE